MPELCTLQRHYRDVLTSIAIGGAAYLPTLLLIGPSGAGKRTLAQAAAEALGMQFLALRVDGDAKQVQELLSAMLADNTSNVLLYLTGVEGIDSSLWNYFASFITTKTFKDMAGRLWRISSDAWVVGALRTSGGDFLVGPEHWLCANFDQRTRIFPPTETGDLMKICENLVRESQVVRSLDEGIAGLFAPKLSISDHLHSIRRWIEIASSLHTGHGPLTRAHVEEAMVEDLRWVLAKLSYRGASLTVSQFSRWADQFSAGLQPMAAHLVRQIADSYFISPREFYQIVDDLIDKSGMETGSAIAFCRSEPLGKGSPRTAHIFKNQARWRAVCEVDLNADPRGWPNLRTRGVRGLVLADDFVGSGKTLSGLFGHSGRLTMLLRANPEISLQILVIAGFEEGLRKVKASIPIDLSKRARLVPGRLFTSRDQCFNPKSRILPSEHQRNALRKFCLDVAEVHYSNLKLDHRLGFAGVGSLVVFPDTVPNNSLPILWHDSGSWVPLFPASGLSAT